MLPAALHGRRGRAQLLVTLGILSAFGPMSTDLYLPAFPEIAASFDTDTAAVRITLAASFLGLGLGQLVYGPVSDRFGRRRPLMGGLLLFIVASLGCAWAPTLSILTGMRLLQALGGCAGLVLARAMVRDCYSGTAMARTMSLMTMVFALAPLLAPSFGALVISVASWPWMFVSLALFGAFCLALVIVLPETHPAHARTRVGLVGALRGYSRVLSSGDFVLPTAIVCLGSVTLFSYIASSPAVLMEHYGFTPQQFAIAFGGISLAIVTGSQVNVRLLRRHSVPRLLRGYLTLQTSFAALLVLLALCDAPVVLVIGTLVALIMCFAGTSANAVTEALRSFPHLAGTASATLGVGQFLFGALISSLLARVQATPTIAMSVTMATASLLALTVAVAGRRALR